MTLPSSATCIGLPRAAATALTVTKVARADSSRFVILVYVQKREGSQTHFGSRQKILSCEEKIGKEIVNKE